MNLLKRIFRRGSANITAPPAPVPPPPQRTVQTRDAVPRHKRLYQSAVVNRLTQDWNTSISSANAQILTSRPAVIERTRQQERDNPYMRKILSLKVNNVVGHRGIRLQMAVKDATGKTDRDACKIIKAAWDKSGRKEYCTVTRSLSRIDCQELAARSLVRDGGMLFRKRRGFHNAFSFALEPIEIDRLDHNYNQNAAGTDNKIRFGIEYDKFNAPLFYHILTVHPGDVFATAAGPAYREKVPADEIIAIWTPERAEQLVGMPTTTGILKRLNIIDKYDEAEATAAYIASCKGGFLEKTNTSDEYVGEDDGNGNTVTEMQPGMIEELPEGYTYKANEPSHPTDAYPYFIKTQLRAVASGADVTYHDLANDLEGVNYSSIRSGTLEARESYKRDQRLLEEQLMTPWFEEWLLYALLSGEIPLPVAQIEKWNAPVWKARRWPWVDPKNDVESSVLEVEAGFTSRRRVIAENDDGAGIDEIFEEQEEDNDLAEEHHLDFSAEPVDPALPKGPANPNEKPPAKPGA